MENFAAENHGKKKRILVVDDSSIIRGIIKQELEDGGYEVIEARDGISGLSSAAIFPPPDLVTLDIEMPRINGFETCRRLHGDLFSSFFAYGKDHRLPVIFITGNDSLRDRIKGFEIGVTDFITKPFNKGEILNTVNMILKPSKRFVGLKAIIADNNATTRKVIGDLLKREGVFTIEAKDENSIFDSIKQFGSDINLIFFNFFQINTGGANFCIKLRKELKRHDIMLICLISADEKSFLLEILKAGVNDYIETPFTKEEFNSRINIYAEKILSEKKQKQISNSSNINLSPETIENISKKFDNNFFSHMSHEIRTPLNAILCMSQLAINLKLPAKVTNYLNTILESGNHLLSISNDILDFFQIQTNRFILEKKDFILKEILESTIGQFNKQADEKGLKISFFIDDKIPPLLVGDANRLMQIMRNILSNSVKFTEKGSISIKINLKNKHSDNVKINFTVKDTGIGIKKEILSEVFVPFVQGDSSMTRKYGGIGLGLTLCKNLIERMGGEISLSSSDEYLSDEKNQKVEDLSENNGFRVDFTLEFEISKFSNLNEFKKSQSLVNFTGKRALLVEDNVINQQVAISILGDAGIIVKIANHGKEAIKALEEDEKFDVIFMDIQMPEMDGYETSQMIRSDSRFKDLPIIALTAHAFQGDREKCINAGMNDYITKPIDRDKLFSTLQKWISQSQESPQTDNLDHKSGSCLLNEQTEIDLPDSLPGIDIASSLKRIGGNKKLFKKLIKDFYHDHLEVFDQIKAALLNEDTELAHRLAHTIKGVAGVFSAKDLFTAASELEKGIKQNIKENLDMLLDSFKINLNQVLESAKNIEPFKEEIIQTDPVTNTNDPSKISSVLSELAYLFKENDMLAEERFKSARQYLNDCRINSSVNKLEECIRSLDFEEANSILVEIAKCLNVQLVEIIKNEKSDDKENDNCSAIS